MRGTELIIFDCDGVLVDSEIVGINIEVDLLLGAGCEISVGEFTGTFQRYELEGYPSRSGTGALD